MYQEFEKNQVLWYGLRLQYSYPTWALFMSVSVLFVVGRIPNHDSIFGGQGSLSKHVITDWNQVQESYLGTDTCIASTYQQRRSSSWKSNALPISDTQRCSNEKIQNGTSNRILYGEQQWEAHRDLFWRNTAHMAHLSRLIIQGGHNFSYYTFHQWMKTVKSNV